jgi:hypothetical protein
MKLLIWNEKNVQGCDDKQIFLRLMDDTDGSGDINLTAVDKDGVALERGNILLVSKNIRAIIINGALNKDIPIKTDFYGHACFELGKNLAMQQRIMEMQTYGIMVGQPGELQEETTH